MHPELETYARDVALEIEKQVLEEGLDYIIVKESPVKRNFAKLLEEYDAGWIFDLHSDVTEPYWVKKSDKWVRALPYPKLGRRTLWDRRRPPSDYCDLIGKPTPIARVVYGGAIRDPHATLELGHLKPRNWVGETLLKFALET